MEKTPTHQKALVKGNHSYSTDSDESNGQFQIIGKKIRLVDRKNEAQIRLIDSTLCSDINMEILRFKATQHESMQLKRLKVLGNKYQCDKKAMHEGVYLSRQLVNERDGFQLETVGENTSIPKSSTSHLETQKKGSFLEKKGPQIQISLPVAHLQSQDEQNEELGEEDLFKEKTYMVCQQPSSNEAHWKTTCVNFPKDTWMLERRRLSHRHSSFGSSVSLSFARLDLACKTPDQGQITTPINGGYFVFPKMKDNK